MQTENEEEKPGEQAPAVETDHEDAFRVSINELKAEVGELRKALAARPPAKVADIDAAAGRREEPRLTKEALAKMTQAEIARLDWNEVRRVLSAG